MAHALVANVDLEGRDFAEAEKVLNAEVIPAVKQAPGFQSGVWLRSPGVDPDELAAVPLFSSLGPPQLARVSALARVREAARGERIVEQWTTSREFFVVLDGAVDVFIDDEQVNTLAAGDFFGEFAALDWAAGYTYPRLASVVAAEALRLLVFPDGALNTLVQEFPAVDTVIRAALHERLPRR